MRYKVLIVVFLSICMTQVVSVSAATGYEQGAKRVGVLYGVVVPRHYHAAMGCYLDATLVTMTKVLSAQYKQEYTPTSLPTVCTEVETLTYQGVTLSTQHIVDTVVALMGEEGIGGMVESQLKASNAALAEGIFSNNIPLEALIYQDVLQPEYEAYRDFLFVDQTVLSPDEQQKILSREPQGGALEDAVVFPSSVSSELRSARSLVEAQRKVIAEYHRALVIHFELQILKKNIQMLLSSNEGLTRAITTLAAKLPAVLAK